MKDNKNYIAESARHENELDVFIPAVGKKEIRDEILYPQNENCVVGSFRLYLPKEPKYESLDDLMFYFEKFAGRVGYGLHYAFLLREIRRVNEYMRNFGRTIWHDAKGSVLNIHSTIRLVQKKKISENEFGEKLEEMRQRCSKLDKLLTMGAQESPYEMRRLEIKNDDVDLVGIMNDAIDFYYADIKKHGIDVERKYGVDEAHVLGDAIWLPSAYRNLISNAIKYGDKQKIIAGVEDADDSYHTYIWNSGGGVPKEHRDSIFEYGFRADEKGEGVGFGLWNVKNIVEKHNGKIGIESDGKTYASFKIMLRKP